MQNSVSWKIFGHVIKALNLSKNDIEKGNHFITSIKNNILNIKQTTSVSDENGWNYDKLIKEYNIDINEVYSDFQQKIFNKLLEEKGSYQHIMDDKGKKLKENSWTGVSFTL